jgi:hypothetical protein
LEAANYHARGAHDAGALMRGLGFSADDLESNQRGMLSEAQRIRLLELGRVPRREDAYLWMGVLAICAHLVIGWVDASLSRGDSEGFGPTQWFDDGFSLLELVIVVGICFWTWGRALYRQIEIKSAVARLGVSIVQGPAELGKHHTPDPRFDHRYLRVGGSTFPATEETARFFEAGRDYRLYFVDYGGHRTVLSAEPIMP